MSNNDININLPVNHKLKELAGYYEDGCSILVDVFYPTGTLHLMYTSDLGTWEANVNNHDHVVHIVNEVARELRDAMSASDDGIVDVGNIICHDDMLFIRENVSNRAVVSMKKAIGYHVDVKYHRIKEYWDGDQYLMNEEPFETMRFEASK